MSSGGPRRSRLAILVDLVDREDQHLLAVRRRLLGNDCAVDTDRLCHVLADDLGIDRLESFGAKFARMQDTVVDKLIPALLKEAGEKVSTAIDNLGRMERFDLIASADDWLQMRGLRNRLIHEYIDRPEDLAPALERACEFTDRMHHDYGAIREYATTRLGVALPNNDTASEF